MRKPTLNLRKMKKHSQVYRKAAEILQYNLETKHGDVDGCCSAFSAIDCMTWNKIYAAPSSTELSVRRVAYAVRDLVEEAADEFAKLFKPEHRPLYWFGTTVPSRNIVSLPS